MWKVGFFSLPKNNNYIAKDHGLCCCWMAKDHPLAFPAEQSLMLLCWVIPPDFTLLEPVCADVFESRLYFWVDVMGISHRIRLDSTC